MPIKKIEPFYFYYKEPFNSDTIINNGEIEIAACYMQTLNPAERLEVIDYITNPGKYIQIIPAPFPHNILNWIRSTFNLWELL